MSNNISHYFGAYLEIRVNKAQREKKILSCPNGHSYKNFPFCPECGMKISEKVVTYDEYPTNIVDDILDDDWEDILSVITPPSLYGTGVILARGNSTDDQEWLDIYEGQYPEEEIKDFPSQDEIVGMIGKILDDYWNIIAELEKSSLVENISVQAGYVLNAEY